MAFLHQIGFGIGISGVLVVTFGVVSGLIQLFRTELKALRGGNVQGDRKHLRHALGYYILLGLEFLIAADIIETLMKPGMQDLLVLGGIVLIRTVISYSLNGELRTVESVAAAATSVTPHTAPLNAAPTPHRAVPAGLL